MADHVQLPRLRADLALQLLAERGGKMPSLVISDQLQGKYLKLQWPESGLLLCLRDATSTDELKAVVAARFGFDAHDAMIRELLEFAHTNQLTEQDENGGWRRYDTSARSTRQGVLKSVVNAYLFMRIPLLRPQIFLQHLMPWLGFFYRKGFWFALGVVFCLFTWLASRQSEALLQSAAQAFALQGIGLYAVAVIVLKAFHELGHALTAVRLGTRVPSMGVALMFGAPVLYTDTSDSWRLAQRRHRLLVVFAGVAAEAVIAVACLGLWVFLPDGTARALCFAFATTSIVLTIMVNLNPFMRYDGYFALSDVLDVPNLQSRSFALGTWAIRRVVLGNREAPAEQFESWKQRFLIVYAFMTWTYRVLMFLGICALLLHTLGKLVGGALALFEIWVFVVLPVVKEVGRWRGSFVAANRNIGRLAVSSAIAASAAVLFLYPWLDRISAPAVHLAARESAVYAPVPALVKHVLVREGQRVQAGQVLAILHSPKLESDLEKSEIRLAHLLHELRALDASILPPHHKQVILEKIKEEERARSGVRSLLQALDIKAPIAGIVRDLDEGLSAEQWVRIQSALLHITGGDGSRVLALVPEEDSSRLAESPTARFIADDVVLPPFTSRPGASADFVGGIIPENILADVFGGFVPVSDIDGDLRVTTGWLAYRFDVKEMAPSSIVRGKVTIAAEPISPAAILWRRIASVLAREQVL